MRSGALPPESLETIAARRAGTVNAVYRARKHWRHAAGALVAALALGSCGHPATAPAAAQPPAGSAPAAAAAAQPPTAAWMERVARGEVRLADLVDPERGLIVAGYYSDPSEQDPRADDEGMVRFAERVCGADADAAVARLAADLAARSKEPDEQPLFRCSGWVCTHRAAAEYDLDGRYRFVARGGERRLAAVVRIEGGPVTEEFVAEAEAWIEKRLPALEASGCPAP